ncbi:MAG TPA: DUF4386 domain-containing protein [Chitinophagaceae bacterium]
MENSIATLKKTARLAGLLYLVLILTAIYAHMYVPSQIFVRGNAVATTNNILQNEFLFRTCVVVNLVEVTVFLFLVLVLYRLFKGVNHHLARVMVAFVGAQIPVVFVLAAFKITALMIVTGDVTASFAPVSQPEQAMLFLKMNEYGMMALELLWGLWLFPFGMLVYRSRFIPRLLGALLVLAAIGYTLGSLTYMLFPLYHSQTQVVAFICSGIGEISIMFWFLIKGVKKHITIEVESERITAVPPSAVMPGLYTK